MDHQLAEERRDSCASGQFLGLLPDLDVSNPAAEQHLHSAMGSYSPHEECTFTNSPDALDLAGASGDLRLQHQHIEQSQVQQQQIEQQPRAASSYPSPAPTISSGGIQSPHVPGSSTPVGVPASVPISTSSELAFALENKPEQQNTTRQEQYATYDGTEHQRVTEQDAAAYYTTQHQHEEQPLSQQHQEAPAYPSYSSLSDAYSTEAHQQQTHQQEHQISSFLSVYDHTGAYVDPLSAPLPVVGMDNGMESVDAFAAYT